MDIEKSLGYMTENSSISSDQSIKEYINLRLMSLGFSIESRDFHMTEIAEPLLSEINDFRRLFQDYNCQPDQRIIDFCERYFADLPAEEKHEWIPRNTFVTDRHGVARVLSLPSDGDEFHSEYIDSYRVYQGVLHNPLIDKRTTKGVFHIAEGGFPVPADKIEVPKIVFARMLKFACNPPQHILELPFASTKEKKVYTFVSGYLKPIICPEIPGYETEKRMEIRFFAPGSLVNFLDMIESIFGNAGSPISPANDPALDPKTWTGHTGCIIAAPHLTKLTKKQLGLPHISKATERQKREGMCWERDDELYHNGRPFKIMARDKTGVIISIIADSYNGYAKKEIKTQMSYSANLFGLCEEEHSGGALAFPRYDLGDDFCFDYIGKCSQKYTDFLKNNEIANTCDDGYACDKKFDDIIYVPEDAHFSKFDQKITWKNGSEEHSLKMKPDFIYILPNGYQVELKKDKLSGQWRLIGTSGEGVFCHKPSTVSGGGKSEIAKSIEDNVLIGNFVIHNFEEDCLKVDEVLKHDIGNRYKDKGQINLGILDRKRSLGSVIKMFQQSEDQTDEYNRWIASIPSNIKELLYILKLHYRESWGSDWKSHFSVDLVNGMSGHELKYLNQKLVSHYLRIGLNRDSSWNIFSLREDFCAAKKIQLEDDITASVTVPSRKLDNIRNQYYSVKFVENCEYRLYQRPDDAIIPGYDHKTEWDMTQKNLFICNYQPLTKTDVMEMISNSIQFSEYTQPMQEFLRKFLDDQNAPKYIVCPSCRRIMPDGSFSSNMRYLQDREDMVDKRSMWVSKIGTSLARSLPKGAHVYISVDAVISGRRNNCPEDGIRSLCAHNPLHYLELPELFMEFASNVTGKSPSTTGAGLEGVMTKGPFNALSQIVDLNNAFLSYVVSGYEGFISSAGVIGPKIKVGHDISYLIPEIFCRMKADERDPKFLIENGYLDRCKDFEYHGRKIEASRLGYRINSKFVTTFLGRILTSPETVFPETTLCPEKQDIDIFVDSVENIIEAHRRAALLFFEDGAIKYACPPINALLHVMAYGEFEGLKLDSSDFRKLFDCQAVLASNWYLSRLKTYQKIAMNRLNYCLNLMKDFSKKELNKMYIHDLHLDKKIESCENDLKYISSDLYLDDLKGTIGADPMLF